MHRGWHDGDTRSQCLPFWGVPYNTNSIAEVMSRPRRLTAYGGLQHAIGISGKGTSILHRFEEVHDCTHNMCLLGYWDLELLPCGYMDLCVLGFYS